MNNEMPELKAGMILKGTTNPDRLFLYINENWIMSLTDDIYGKKINIVKDNITHIYVSVAFDKTYEACTKDLELIWSRKSDKDIKIEKIQKKMDALSKELEELKG